MKMAATAQVSVQVDVMMVMRAPIVGPRSVASFSQNPRATMTRSSLTLVLVLLSAIGGSREGAAMQTDGPPPTVSSVDLGRYAGRWFEIARFPNRFQRQCVSDVTATYTVKPDGRVDVLNRCRRDDRTVVEASGVARTVSPESNARLEVRFAPAWLSFLPMVWGDYWVIDLDDHYTTAVVGSPDRRYLWLLSRTPNVPEQVYQRLVASAARAGYPIDQLVRTRHE